MFVALLVATGAALAPPALVGLATAEVASDNASLGDLELIVAGFVVTGLLLLGRELRADLPRRLGRPAGAPGPAHPDLRPPPEDVDRLLHPEPARAC